MISCSVLFHSFNQCRRLGRGVQELTAELCRWSGPDTLVRTDTNRVLRVDAPVKRGLEVAVRTQRLLDVPSASPLGPQRQGLEPLNILPVEEHAPNGSDLLVNVVRVTREN